MRTGIAALALAAALGCSYDFNNPAERLGAGQVLGRAVGDVGGAGLLSPLEGVSVALENDPFSQVTRRNGRFTLLSMPVGRHTVLFRKGTTWALQRDVEVRFGADGQVEGVNLGDLRLRYTIELAGTFALPAGFVPAALSVEDETTGASAALASGAAPGEIAYSFLGLPVGPHRIRAVARGSIAGVPTTLVGLRAINVTETDEGKVVPMAAIALAQPAPGFGRIQSRVAIVAPRPVAASSAIVELHDASAPTDPASVTPATLIQTLSPDSTGFVDVEVAVSTYKVRLVPPAVPDLGGQPILLEAPPLRDVVVLPGQVTELGTLYAVDAVSGSSASLACFDSSDCAPVGACVRGSCTNYTPPAAVPPATPFCVPVADLAVACQACSASPEPCASAGGVTTGFCEGAGTGGPKVCMPVGASACTPDGLATYPNTRSCF